MLNNNAPNIPGDPASMKGTACVPPTISKPVYSFVASLPSPTDQQSRQKTTTTSTTTTTTTTTTTSVSTTPTQPKDLITMVSNIVSSPNLAGEKPIVPTTSATVTSRSHIEEVIDDVAKSASTTAIVTEPTASIVDTTPLSSVSTTAAAAKTTPLPNILGNVMKTPCLTSSTTATTTTMTTAASETLNLFDPHRRPTSSSSSSSKTAASTTPTTTTTTTSSTPVVPVVVRPTSAKTPTSHKRSSTPKTDPTPSISSPLIHPFQHMLGSDPALLAAAAAAAHHPNFPFSLFNPLSSNPSGTPSLASSSPPLATRTSSTSSSTAITNSHIMTNPFHNPLATAQATPHTHEKASRR